MRVISQDGRTNTSYESSVFCVIEDPTANEWYVSIRTPNLTNHMPLGTYSTKDDAMAAFTELMKAAENSDMYSNDIFQLR